MSTEDREARVLAMLQRVGMAPPEDYAHRYPHQLSGGEQQRVALVRALLMNPDLILADEAVSALDVSLRVETMDLLLELQDQFDTSFLFISHNLSNARYLAEKADGRVGIMYLGEIVEIGPAEEVLQNPKHPYTEVLRWATADLDPDKQEADEPPVRSIDIPDPVNPPSGCRFHTRCPKVIPPADMDIDQELYNEIMDVRREIQDRTLDTELVARASGGEGRGGDERGAAGGATADGGQRSPEAFARILREQIFERDVPEPHRSNLETAFEHLADGDWARAESHLRERYESVCERRHPETGDDDHPVACHLYDDEVACQPDEPSGSDERVI
jgi:peptide/nickel transport system ATP-binding protein